MPVLCHSFILQFKEEVERGDSGFYLPYRYELKNFSAMNSVVDILSSFVVECEDLLQFNQSSVCFDNELWFHCCSMILRYSYKDMEARSEALINSYWFLIYVIFYTEWKKGRFLIHEELVHIQFGE